MDVLSMPLGAVHPRWRVGVALAVAVALIAGAVFFTANVERSAALAGARQLEASLSVRSAMLDQEDGSRGLLSNDPESLARWQEGTSAFASSLAELTPLVAGDPSLRQSLADQARLAGIWHAETSAAIASLHRTRHLPPRAAIERNRDQMDAFRAANAAFDVLLSKANADRLASATRAVEAVVAGLAAILVAAGWLIARGMVRREAKRHRDQAKLREVLQVSESEHEAQTFLVRHLQTVLPVAEAAVITPASAGGRLTITTADPTDPLAARAGNEQLGPRSCMAVRLGRAYDRRAAGESALRCEICGALEGSSACEPLLVGGETIGSVLVVSRKAIPAELRDRFRDTVAQAAPILANQRNLALAKTLARSDALTGLFNRRAADETIKRLIAQAARSSTPLAVMLLDLDSLKPINDRHGHASGDEALALLGRIIRSTIRASDFAARIGGDEFAIVLPDTDRDGAILTAEKLRAEIARSEIEGVGPISASLGVAMFRADATTAHDLLRKADRALYTAKQQGRNCVGVYAQSPEEHPDEQIEAAGASGSRLKLVDGRSGSDRPPRTALRVIASD